MKYIDEFRDYEKVRFLINRISEIDAGNIKIMEVCGSQTHTIVKYGLEELLPDRISLIHGPGCPVCVTPIEMIDNALKTAEIGEVILATYGDMMRVPGSEKNMLHLKAEGADIRIIYSPLDAVKLAAMYPQKKIVFFAIGFETTAPANAAAIRYAEQLGLNNFFVISSHVLIPPAVEYILSSNEAEIDALLAPGHVCAVTGYRWCEEISVKYNVPIIITGFEPLDILGAILLAVSDIREGEIMVRNQYKRVVTSDGNIEAQRVINEVFELTDRDWRGLGIIPLSGYSLQNKYNNFNAVKEFDIRNTAIIKESECISGEILKGIKKPEECRFFGNKCQPLHPVGAPMVSTEGACAAYFKYKRDFV
jgi:hydrogenase expression/formation protein HypD